jgi:hypothetical protein
MKERMVSVWPELMSAEGDGVDAYIQAHLLAVLLKPLRRHRRFQCAVAGDDGAAEKVAGSFPKASAAGV